MAEIGVDLREFEALANDMVGGIERVTERAIPLVTHWGQLLEARWKANAVTGYHGPREGHIPGTGPGPNAVTGDFQRTIGPAQVAATATEIVAEVGSNAPQAARLEWGFSSDVDSLGRHYRQPPYPSAGPALDWIAPQFEEAALAEGYVLAS